MEAWLWPVLLGVVGAVFGSFIATVAVRWPEGRSALAGRSACDGCGKSLRAHELVPLLSYLLLRGRCAACGAAIRPAHPAIELIGLAIGLGAGIAAPGIEGAAGAAFGWLLLALGALDLAAFWLPNLLTGALAALGLAGALAGIGPPLEPRLIGGAAGFLSLWAVAAGYRAMRGRDGLGGGDPKLFGAIGLWLGWRMLPLVLLGACLLAFAAILALSLRGRRPAMGDRMPLGVFLAAAAWIAWAAMAMGWEG
ncbi:prepilin peptidase [Sphingomonas canadensis]|uniref:Prepilin leader peptidase/N-methyltransferase n=1 Tax=Sphingomonas canadensis TaxID=1219257 RepID=A0ABW3HFU5_9SPHN|nr:prepilin peptidase [Sphingomonas canadensis]MCW3838064.1 prepilin peptidase [Sphingomonas canadensis]